MANYMRDYDDCDLYGMSEEEFLVDTVPMFRDMKAELESTKDECERIFLTLRDELFSKNENISLLKVYDCMYDLLNLTTLKGEELPDRLPLIQKMNSDWQKVFDVSADQIKRS